MINNGIKEMVELLKFKRRGVSPSPV